MKSRFACAVIMACALVSSVSYARNSSEIEPMYAPLRPVVKPQNVRIGADAAPGGHVVVKFRRGMSVDVGKARLAGPDATRTIDVLQQHGLDTPVPLIDSDPQIVRARRMAAEDRLKLNLPDMTLYFWTPISDPQSAADAINALNALDEIEIAYYEPKPEVANYNDANTTPDYEPSESYIEVAPGGVDARAAWTLPGGRGQNIQITDVEFGWQLTHEDLSKGATATVIGVNDLSDTDHGTAVLGEMVSDDNGFGMTGIAQQADINVSSVSTLSTASAILNAASLSEPGDLILIELHAPGPRYNGQGREDQLGYVPMEYFQSDFDAMLSAWGDGVIVCEAAGNGEEDLDDVIYNSVFDTTVRNSHAIMCGAGYPPVNGGGNDRSKLGFSNWGERVNLQGYGVAVWTTGYGDLYVGTGQDSWYTRSFSGTSSASPIVTGAVAALSGVFKNMLGSTLTSDSALALLVPTGSPQTNPNLIRHIGPRPDLFTAIAPLFDPIDSVWYNDIFLEPGQSAPLPVRLSNSHPVGEIYLPFLTTGPATIFLDSMTRGPRTASFEQVGLIFDNRFAGQIGFVLRADNGGGTSQLQAGSGVVANLWVRASPSAQMGQVEVVDSAWLGSLTHLRLTSVFDDGYPDYFSSGSITIGSACTCPMQSDLDSDGFLTALDLNALIDVIFFSAPDVQDADCPNTRSDFDCSGAPDALDLNALIDHLFFGGSGPCDPCN